MWAKNRALRTISVAALAAGGIAVTTTSAHANVEIGGTAGLHVFSKTNELGVNDVSDANSEKNSALFGVRLGVYFGPILGVEGEFGIVPSESRHGVFDVWNIFYRAHLVAQFRAAEPENKLIPFVLAGAGAFQIFDNGGAENDAQIAKDTDAVFYGGAGFKVRVDNGWGLRLDLRLLFPPTSKGDGVTEDFEALLSIYKEWGRPKVAKVEAKVGSGSWTVLAKQDWGTYAKSIHAPNGSLVTFRATSSTGATATSAATTWT
jgi:outer membrane protein W